MNVMLVVGEMPDSSISTALIHDELLKMYQRKVKNLIKLTPTQIEGSSFSNLDSLIAKEQIDFIIILDANGLSVNSFKKIFKISPVISGNLKFVIYLYGDFRDKAEFWMKRNNILQNHPVLFVCLSEAHKVFIQKFLKSTGNVTSIPAPINEMTYEPSLTDRLAKRERLGIDKNGKLFIYAGRISMQKNFEILVQCFEQVLKKSPVKSKLIIVGHFDEFGDPLFGKYWAFGYLELILLKYLNRNIKNIHFIPSVDQKELASLFNAADGFISASTHHDEDFGLAAAQALACGCHALLSNWGGHKQFKNLLPKDVTLFKTVGLGPDRAINSNELIAELSSLITMKIDFKERNERSNRYRMAMGNVNIFARTESEFLTISKFKGFNNHLKRLMDLKKMKPWAPFLKNSKTYGSETTGYAKAEYEKIYSSYWK